MESKTEKIITPAGSHIIMAGYAGNAGASCIAGQKKEELLTRFPGFLIRNAYGFRNEDYTKAVTEYLSKNPDEVQIYAKAEVEAGGVFKALWKLGEEADTGFEVELKSIPLKQETVEICNFFEISPYQLYGAGAVLLLASKGEDFARALLREGIPAKVIGFTHKEKKRVIRNEEEERFIEPRKEDSLWEIPGMELFGGKKA